MTYDEITLWRRFMQDKGTLNNFEYLYREHKYTKQSLDEYLDAVDARDVLLNAFDFTGAGNSIFGFKYWKDLDAKWQVKLQEFSESGQMDPETQVRCSHCGRMLPASMFEYTTRGVLHKHCRECESGEWDKRRREEELAMRDQKAKQQIEQAQADLNKTTKVCDHCGKRKLKSEFDASDTSEDGLQSWCRKCQTAAANVSMEADFLYDREEKRKAMMEEKPKPVKPDRLVAPKLGEYDATLHYKQGQKSLTLNAVLSAQIREGEFTKCYMNIDRSKHAFLIFNRVEGANITGASSLSQALLNVTSADIARTLAARFDLEMGENYYLHITRNLSKTDNVLTVEVLAARPREEYVKIAERRELAAKGKIPPFEAEEEPEICVAPETRNNDIPSSRNNENHNEEPLLDFGDGGSEPPSPDEVIQTVIDRHLVTERDLAIYLHRQGWELQEPVIVKKLKKFTL